MRCRAAAARCAAAISPPMRDILRDAAQIRRAAIADVRLSHGQL